MSRGHYCKCSCNTITYSSLKQSARTQSDSDASSAPKIKKGKQFLLGQIMRKGHTELLFSRIIVALKHAGLKIFFYIFIEMGYVKWNEQTAEDIWIKWRALGDTGILFY